MALELPTVIQLLRVLPPREIAPDDIIDASLPQLRSMEPTLKAFPVTDVQVHRDAAAAAGNRVAGDRPLSPMEGIPIRIKDIVASKGWSTLNGSLTVDPDGSWYMCASRVFELTRQFPQP